MRLRVSILISLLLISGTTEASPTSLDAFLGDFDRTCAGSEAFNSFINTLQRRYNHDGPREGVVAIPTEIRTAIGKVSSVNKGEYTQINVPFLSAVYRGLPVKAIKFSIGHSNGIRVMTIAFSASAADVHRVFDRAVKIGNEKLVADYADVSAPGSIRVSITQGAAPSLVCDLST